MLEITPARKIPSRVARDNDDVPLAKPFQRNIDGQLANLGTYVYSCRSYALFTNGNEETSL